MRKVLQTLLLTLTIATASNAQDIGVVNISAPVTGCVLTTNENVKVQVFNFGPDVTVSMGVSYVINGGPPVTETIPPTLLSGSTYNYTFTTKANLSTPGTYTISAYTTLPGDINPANDLFANYLVNSDPVSAGGIVSANATVCSGSNIGTLTLSTYTGSVSNWEFSTDGGSVWNPIANTSAVIGYSNVVFTSLYRAVIQSGVCPPVNSTIVTITTNSMSVGGTLSSNATVCSGTNNGTLILNGSTGNILNWESSADNGFTWSPIANTSTAIGYNNITSTTLYRTDVKNGVCPVVNSSTVTITTNSISVGGSVLSNTTVCIGLNTGTLTLSGYTGSILNWESSSNGGSTWNPITNSTNTESYSNITATTWYRGKVQTGICPAAPSISATVTVAPLTVGGSIVSNTTVCRGINAGTLYMAGNTGNVLNWEFSTDNGVTWASITNTTYSLNFSDLSKETEYRTKVQSGTCPLDSSLFARVNFFPPVLTAGNDVVIEFETSANLNAQGGTTYFWSPACGLSDTAIPNPVASPTATTLYRVGSTDPNGCPDTAKVQVKVVPGAFKYKIANLITLNNDGFNDKWYIEHIDLYPTSQVLIFDLSGNKIFEASPYLNDWEGTHNGKKVPDGVYYYILRFTDSDKVLKGSINIVSER